MQCTSLLMAERVIRDAETGAVSIINILESIQIEALPIISRASAYAYIEKEESDSGDKFEINILIKNNDKEMASHTLKIDFQGKSKTRLMLNFNGIVIEQPGVLSLDLFLSKVHLGRFAVNIELRKNVTST